jgi:hypothetical protein
MTTIQKTVAAIVALAVIGLCILGLTHKQPAKVLGDATVSNFPTWYYGGIVIGPSISLISDIVSGSCTLSGASSIADRATQVLSCQVPSGVSSGESALVTEDLGKGIGSGPFVIVSAGTDSSPSDCSGLGVQAPCLSVREQNQTGTATAASASALNVHFWITR